MALEERYLTAKDGHEIPLFVWQTSSSRPLGVIQLIHGMAEHSQRYSRFADHLNQKGFAVVAHDHRGHGRNLRLGVTKGFWGSENGWEKVIADVLQVNQLIEKEFSELPRFIFGHSMGSFITQQFIAENGDGLTGVILSGSTYDPPLKFKLAAAVAKVESIRGGKEGTSAVIDFLSFGSFNNSFRPTRTDYDWLSRCNEEVDAYIADELCGFRCTNKLWIDMLGGLLHISGSRYSSKSFRKLPFLLICGEKDPVGGKKGNQRLARRLSKLGVDDLTLQIYPDGRHEMLNETNRDQVEQNIVSWLTTKISPPL